MGPAVRNILGWVIVIVIAFIALVAVIIGLAVFIDNDSLSARLLGGLGIMTIIAFAKLGLMLRDKLLGRSGRME